MGGDSTYGAQLQSQSLGFEQSSVSGEQSQSPEYRNSSRPTSGL